MLSHAEFPFVGRNHEIEAILSFYQSAITADNLSVLWIEGEAGIGKTHLLKQVVQHISHGNSILCHIRLYPDTPSTINELLDHNLAMASHLQALLKQRRTSSTAGKIRHLARLRPTTLILEDLHLLPDGEGQNLFSLFQALAEEPVCIICASRPGEHPASLRLLPYISQRMELTPLQENDIRMLLEHFPYQTFSNTFIETLQATTNGIPLVLRSVLAAIPKDSERNSSIQSELLITQLIEHNAKTSVQSLTAGLTAFLSPDEYQQACVLATLGEVFSEEAAQLIVATASETLEALAQKGIITQVREAILPIIGTASHKLPWRFAHTLLRNELGTHQRVSADNLLLVLDENAPLYSTTLLRELTARQIKDSNQLLRTHRYIIALLKKHELEYHFSLLLELATITNHFLEVNSSLLSELLEVNVELDTISLMHFQESLRNTDSTRIKETVSTYLERTEAPKKLVDAEHRLIALVSVLFQQGKIPDLQTALTPLSCLEEVESLLTHFPQLHKSVDFIRFLISIAATTRTALNPEVIRQLRLYLSMILDTAEEARAYDQEYVHTLVAMVLTLFITEKEAQYCTDLAERTLAKHELHELPEQFSMCYISLLVNTGQMYKAKDVLTYLQSNAAIQSTHSAYTRFLYLIERILIDVAFGAPQFFVVHQLNQAIRWVRNADIEFAGSYCERIALGVILSASHLQNNKPWLEAAIEKQESNPALQNEIQQIRNAYALFTGNIDQLRSAIESNFSYTRFYGLIECGTAEKVNVDLVYHEARQFLEENSVNRSVILAIGAVAALVENIFTQISQPITPALHTLIVEALRRALQWCKNGDLVGFMESFLQKSKNYFSNDEYQYWHQALIDAEKNVARKYQWQTEVVADQPVSKVKLSMLGQISVALAGDQPKRVQGAKARAILGLMVANELSRRRLTYKGFREVIFNDTEEPNDSTTNIRAAIARIRSLIGRESIITDGKSAPAINVEIVDVDLIRISQTLKQCTEAVRACYPRKAKQLIIEVLNYNLDEPAYPTLYNEFFESARLDFELDIRNTVLAVSNLLRQEGDIEGVITILQDGLKHMPGDEDLLTLLSDMLSMVGRNNESMSVRNSWV